MAEWEDITIACKAASDVLNDVVPFVATNSFSLYEAMSAVELMDQKMDPCYGMTRPYRFVDVIRGSIPSDMSQDTSLAVLSHLLIREVSFLDGASLLESINQCAFVWPDAWTAPTSPSGGVVMYYSRELVRSLSHIIRGVLDADIFEDEDYQHTSRPSAEKLPVTAAPITESTDLHLFLSLRQTLDQLYELLAQVIAKYCRKTPLQHDMFIAEVGNIRQAVTDVEKCVTELRLRDFKFIDAPNMDAMFSTKIMHILQVAPTRNIAFSSFQASLDYIASMCAQISTITTFISELHVTRKYSYMEVLFFLKRFAAESSGVLVRSLLLAYIHTIPITESFENSMRQYHFPESLLQSSHVKKWFSVISPILFEGFKLFTVYRTKILPRLTHLLDKLTMLVRDAAALDVMIKSNDEGVVYNKTCQWLYVSLTSLLTYFMDLNFELTVEMNLLHISEVAYFYWYWDHVLTTRVWTFQQLREMDFRERGAAHEAAVQEAQRAIESAKSQSSSKRKKAEQHLNKIKTQTISPLDTSVEETQWNLKATLCRGYYHMFVVYKELHMISVTDLPYCDVATKFGNRFRCFQGIDVPNLTQHYGGFVSYISSLQVGNELNYTEILSSLITLFKKCKLFPDKLKQLGVTTLTEEMAYVKASVACCISCAKLLADVEKGDKAKYEGARLVLNATHSLLFPEVKIELAAK